MQLNLLPILTHTQTLYASTMRPKTGPYTFGTDIWYCLLIDHYLVVQSKTVSGTVRQL